MRQFAIAVLSIALVYSTNVAAGNVVSDQAEKSGIRKCLHAVKSVSDFLIKDGNVGIHSTWNSKHPDQQVFSTVIERNFKDGGTLLTSLTISPVTSGQCAAVYDQIGYSPMSCTALSKDTYGKYEYKLAVNKNVILLESDGTEIYLLPADGGGCVSLKKEVIMNISPSR